MNCGFQAPGGKVLMIKMPVRVPYDYRRYPPTFSPTQKLKHGFSSLNSQNIFSNFDVILKDFRSSTSFSYELQLKLFRHSSAQAIQKFFIIKTDSSGRIIPKLNLNMTGIHHQLDFDNQDDIIDRQ